MKRVVSVILMWFWLKQFERNTHDINVISGLMVIMSTARDKNSEIRKKY
ncbi:MAG: hypothetical protein LBL77_02800 [Endomicrobium sp.]|jgi:hypothetical protein|nr:hypothetical protein [Endomicrobium sp.]